MASINMEPDGDTIDLSKLTGELKSFVDDENAVASKGSFLSPTNAKQYVVAWKNNLKPEFFKTTRFKAPNNFAHATSRVLQNVTHFKSNYMLVTVLLVVYCILTSPSLFIALMVGLGAAYIVHIRDPEQKLKLFGREFTKPQQYALVGAVCFPVFWLAGAGSAVFWILGASFFMIMAHATTYAIEDVPKQDDLEELQVI